MRKTSIILAALITACFFIRNSALAVEPPSGLITVTNYGQRGTVTFDHSEHVKQEGMTCFKCHHKAEQDPENKKLYKCGGEDCHSLEETEKKPRIQYAAHGKEVGKCYDCHWKKDAEDRKRCPECHVGE